MIQKQIQERQKKREKNKTQESLKEDRLFCFFPPVCKWETPVWVTYSIHEASE